MVINVSVPNDYCSGLQMNTFYHSHSGISVPLVQWRALLDTRVQFLLMYVSSEP